MIRRLAAYTALGVVAGALLTVAAGLAFAVAEQQVAYRRTLTRRTRAIHFTN